MKQDTVDLDLFAYRIEAAKQISHDLRTDHRHTAFAAQIATGNEPPMIKLIGVCNGIIGRDPNDLNALLFAAILDRLSGLHLRRNSGHARQAS